MQISILSHGDGTGSVTANVEGDIKVAGSDHPNFGKIREAALDILGDEAFVEEGEFLELFDPSIAVATKFEGLSENVKVADGRVYFDGDEVDSSITQEIVRFLHADEADWIPLVHFFEKVQANPNQHSREQLFDWLRDREFTITKDGNIITYKGITADMHSVFGGKAIVNGVAVTGKIPNPVGAVVEMPRSEVTHDPAAGCSVGLHAATHAFATGYGTTVVSLEVNPRDVVSVPTDSSAEKMRVCKYKVREVITEPYSGLVAPPAAEVTAVLDEDDLSLDPEGDDWDW